MGADEISLLEVANVLLRHRQCMVGVPLALAILVVGVGLLLPRSYSSSASFVPESDEAQPSRLAGVAAQFGIDFGSVRGGRSPQFYADLLRSREILEGVIRTHYSSSAGDDGWDAGNLLDLLAIEGETPGLRMARAVERLRRDLSVEIKAETGVVSFSVEAPWPGLAQQIAQRTIELVNQFNLETRQSQAAAERNFLEDRLAAAKRDLRAAEDSLERFLDRNRSYQNSPALRFEYDRFQRRVSLHQQVVTSLSQAYEQARTDEVRDTPVITVVESPRLPPQPDRRWLAVKGLIAILIGGLLAAIWAFGKEFYARTEQEQPKEYQRFLHLLDEVRMEIRDILSSLPGKRWRDGRH